MTTSTCAKCASLILFVMGCVMLLVPYPSIRQLIIDRDLGTYNCTDARDFTYSGKSGGAYRATALANMTINISNSSTSVPSGNNSSGDVVVVVKLRYPGLTTWLPYSFNSHADTTKWYTELSNSGFQCVSNGNWAYTQPALPNLPLYYASCAGGVIFMFLSVFICFMNSRRQRQSRYDYSYIN